MRNRSVSGNQKQQVIRQVELLCFGAKRNRIPFDSSLAFGWDYSGDWTPGYTCKRSIGMTTHWLIVRVIHFVRIVLSISTFNHRHVAGEEEASLASVSARVRLKRLC